MIQLVANAEGIDQHDFDISAGRCPDQAAVGATSVGWTLREWLGEGKGCGVAFTPGAVSLSLCPYPCPCFRGGKDLILILI